MWWQQSVEVKGINTPSEIWRVGRLYQQLSQVPINPSSIYFLGKKKVPIKPSNPTSWFYPGLSQALSPTNPFPGPTRVPHPLANPGLPWLVYASLGLPLGSHCSCPKVETPLPVLSSTVHVKKSWKVIWFSLHRCLAEECPFLLSLGI